jgi:hypothetical protein
MYTTYTTYLGGGWRRGALVALVLGLLGEVGLDGGHLQEGLRVVGQCRQHLLVVGQRLRLPPQCTQGRTAPVVRLQGGGAGAWGGH